MSRRRRRHSSAFKAKVAMEALKGEKTAAQLASEYELQPTQISAWKKHLVEKLPQVFEPKSQLNQSHDKNTAALYEEIGRLKMELDWLKKKLT